MNAHTTLNEILILCKLQFNKPPLKLKGKTPLELANDRIYSIFRRGPYETVDQIIKFVNEISSVRNADIYCPGGCNRITGFNGYPAFTCHNGVIVDEFQQHPMALDEEDFEEEYNEDEENEENDF